MEESGRHYVGQKTEETTKRKSVGSLRGTSLYIGVGNTGTDRETGGEDADSRKQLGRRICKLTQEDTRKMKELREEIGMKIHLKMKVAGSRMRWERYVQRMGEDRLSKRAWKAEEGGRRRRGRPKLRRKDCVKRDLERAGMNGREWKTIAEDRGKWRTLTTKVEEAIK